MQGDTSADRLAVRELVDRYADAVARRDDAAWGSTWAEDGEWHILGQATTGREAVVGLWRTLMAGFAFVVQLPGPGVVEITGDSGTGRWMVTELGRGPDGPMLTLGVYHDVYRRDADGWRFARRRFDILYSGPPDLGGETFPFPRQV